MGANYEKLYGTDQFICKTCKQNQMYPNQIGDYIMGFRCSCCGAVNYPTKDPRGNMPAKGNRVAGVGEARNKVVGEHASRGNTVGDSAAREAAVNAKIVMLHEKVRQLEQKLECYIKAEQEGKLFVGILECGRIAYVPVEFH